jgi:AcrR family transcriptional regulator
VSKQRVRRQLVQNEIFDRAEELFAERGFNGTSLQDVADALGVTRSALYYYVDSKEALLEALVADTSKDAADGLDAIASSELSPPDKLRAAVVDEVKRISSRPSRLRLLDRCEPDFPEHVAVLHRTAEHRLLDAMAGIIDAGVTGGYFRPVHPKVTACSILGMCNWIAWWWQADGEVNGDDLAVSIADIAVNGLVHRSAADGRPADPNALVAELHEQLDRLHRMIS